MSFHVVIPARFNSEKIAGKPLVELKPGLTILEKVFNQASKSGAMTITVATDEVKVVDVVENFGGRAILTSSSHLSDTERLGEVVDSIGFNDDDVIVNVHCNQVMIPPDIIKQVADDLLIHDNTKVATLCESITDIHELFDPSIVKVVTNKRGFAMYFSRAPIAWERESFSEDPREMM